MDEAPVTIYTTGWCGFCMQAKALLARKGVTFREVDVSDGPALREEMIARSGRRTVPQVFIGDRHLGGLDELTAADRSGELDKLLDTAG
jgi:glutaredoxin 3